MSAEQEVRYPSTDSVPFKWHWISDRQSAENGEVSVLAIVETVLAGVLSYLIYKWRGELWHVSVAACLAPFLLLRTDRVNTFSLELAAPVFKTIDASTRQRIPKGSGYNIFSFFYSLWIIFLFFVFIFGTPFIILAIKAISTLRCLIAHPIETVGEIPRNWRRVVLCTDTGAIPELIPTLERVPAGSPLDSLKASEVIRNITAGLRWHGDVVRYLDKASDILVIGLFISAFLLLPALVYRFSVKSTAAIWSPLLWAAWRSIKGATEVRITMSRILTREVYKISRGFSLIVAALFVFKMLIWIKWNELHYVYDTIFGAADPYIVPTKIPIWHIASLCNAFLAWMLYYISDYYYKDLKDGVRIPEKPLAYTFIWVAFLMNLLMFYSLICTVYITVQSTSTWNLPPLEANFLPWLGSEN